MSLPPPLRRVTYSGRRNGRVASGIRVVPEETAIALSYNRVAHAVMMATPTALEDFAIGFSLNEGIVATPQDVFELDIVPSDKGIELRMWIGDDRMEALLNRRRHLAGATGCGMCGLESLDAATREPPRVNAPLRFGSEAISSAMAFLAEAQNLNNKTHAVHAAGLWMPTVGLVAAREDVGRHNALDKLAGCLAREGVEAVQGMVLLTSRISVELVQKAAMMGVGVLAAVSAPTSLALRVADRVGITLVGVVRHDGFEIYTHAERIAQELASDVA